MSSAVSGPTGSDRSGRQIAYVAALFGLLGTLCGSAITYLGNRALQDQQISQQNAAEAKATRAAARLAVFRYEGYDNLAKEMLMQDMYYPAPTGQPWSQPLSASNEALIVGSLSINGLNALSFADDGVSDVSMVLGDGTNGAQLKTGALTILTIASGDLDMGLAVLTRIATQRLS